MKKALFVLISCLVLSQTAFAEKQLLDQVVAVVNEEAITQSELDGYLRPYFEQLKQQFQGENLMMEVNEARKKLLNQMVEDLLVYQEAKRLKIEVDEVAIDEQMIGLRGKFTDEKQMEEALHAEGLSMKMMKERLLRQQMIRQLHDQEVRSKIVVSPTELENYYKEHAAEFSHRERIKVRSITIKKNDEAREKGIIDESAKAKIEDLRKQVNEGGDMAKLAELNSEDAQSKKSGLSDWIQRGEMVAEIDEVIFGLKKGDTSEIIETPQGYHFFKIEEAEAGYQKKFEEARDQIYDVIYRKKFKEKFDEWMSKLRRTAYISVR